jgi:hypothetical protein
MYKKIANNGLRQHLLNFKIKPHYDKSAIMPSPHGIITIKFSYFYQNAQKLKNKALITTVLDQFRF